jgi:hypothetical protein
VRQPIGGDFAFSSDVVNEIYDQDVWDTDVGRFGIDIWLTTNALVRGFNICQARLGAKIHDVKDPSESLGPMFRQVVATLFSLMEENSSHWYDLDGSSEVPILGSEIETEPEPFPINVENLIDAFRHGYTQFGPLWKNVLSEETFRQVEALAESKDGFDMECKLWSHILYDAAATYHCWQKNRFKLIELLTPLYYARVASFANTVMSMDDMQAEEEIEKQARIFEKEKPYLVKAWAMSDDHIANGKRCGQPS